ncbi:MAG: PilN domain-containing protein [Candidatus Zhuqueibacterota bacterium]
MSKEKQEQKTWKAAAILLIILLTGFFIGQNLRARNKVYSENIIAGSRILNELQNKIDTRLDAKAQVAADVPGVNRPQALRMSQILQQVGKEAPSSLWLESIQLETEKVGSRSNLVKISTSPDRQKSEKEILYFDGRAVDREAIKNFLHQVEGTNQWEKVTLSHIEWIGSNQNGIWEFTIQLIR